jgi:hypothetical protein
MGYDAQCKLVKTINDVLLNKFANCWDIKQCGAVRVYKWIVSTCQINELLECKDKIFDCVCLICGNTL